MAIFLGGSAFDIFEMGEVGDFLQLGIPDIFANSQMAAHNCPVSAGIEDVSGGVLGSICGERDIAVVQPCDAIDPGILPDRCPGFESGIEEHFIKGRPLDVECWRTGEQPLVETESNRTSLVIPHHKFRAQLGHMRQLPQGRLQSQLLNERQIERQDRLADMEAGEDRLLQHQYLKPRSRQRDG